jgi:hypothetical protein
LGDSPPELHALRDRAGANPFTGIGGCCARTASGAAEQQYELAALH